MISEEIAAIFASQTAIMATLIGHLARASIVDKLAFVKELYALLERTELEKNSEALAGPIRHLINVLESGSE